MQRTLCSRHPKYPVYFDLGASYSFGIGEYGGSGYGNNEETMFNFGAGFEVFIKK